MIQPNPIRSCPQQDKVIDFIRAFRALRGYPPTFREIGQGIEPPITVTSVRNLCLALSRKGRLYWLERQARTFSEEAING